MHAAYLEVNVNQYQQKGELKSTCKRSHRNNTVRVGFTLGEMTAVLVIMSILVITTAPYVTQSSETKTGNDKNVLQCITENSSAGWYIDGTGATSLPSADPCLAAVTGAQYNRGNTLSTVMRYADIGTSAEQNMAKKILRAACDQGGRKACDY